MGGINIYCGSFVGRDKSGTPFETVLAESANGAGQEVECVVASIGDALEVASDHILVDPADAAKLIEPLQGWLQLNINDSRPLLKECAEDLIEACRVATSDGEPVAIVW